MESEYPGMWQRWFVHQCVAVGWYTAKHKEERGWKVALKILNRIEIGDFIVVALSGHRLARLGEVTGKAVGDDTWNPLVPRDPSLPDGDMGRRILVRWDMLTGPDDREMVVLLPEGARFTPGELRLTLSEIRSLKLDDLKNAMNDQSNWVGLWGHFDYERALSGYIAAYPHRLEDGLLPHPNGKIRERVFKDGSRLDVILLDRNGMPVIVECKQGQPTVDNLGQLRGYIRNLETETKTNARGILIHGGAKKLRHEVEVAASTSPKIEIIRYRLDVDFTPSN